MCLNQQERKLIETKSKTEILQASSELELARAGVLDAQIQRIKQEKRKQQEISQQNFDFIKAQFAAEYSGAKKAKKVKKAKKGKKDKSKSKKEKKKKAKKSKKKQRTVSSSSSDSSSASSSESSSASSSESNSE